MSNYELYILGKINSHRILWNAQRIYQQNQIANFTIASRRHFLVKGIQTPNRCMEQCSISQITMEMSIKTMRDMKLTLEVLLPGQEITRLTIIRKRKSFCFVEMCSHLVSGHISKVRQQAWERTPASPRVLSWRRKRCLCLSGSSFLAIAETNTMT